MKSRILGKSGFNVSEVGLGCWQLGSDWGDSISKEKAFAILQEAIDQGITFFDTANVYGDGQSERFIGEFIKGLKNKPRIATKFGRGDAVYPDKYSEELLRKSVKDSANRLGIKKIDLVQLHCVPIAVLRDGEIFNWLRKLQNEGLIRHFGASVETVEEGLLCLEQEGILSLQVIFNVFRQKLLTELLPQAKKKGVGIIVRLPLASGLLAGKYTKNTSFPENDHRNYNKDGAFFNVGETFAGVPFEKGVELVNSIKKEFLPNTLNLVQFTLRWILDHDAVSTIIPGASSPKQVKSNAEASDIAPLSQELHQKLYEFYTQEIHEFVRGAY
jgi:aryl-alcohol dehydrogenase-like predicted oxidoreductase